MDRPLIYLDQAATSHPKPPAVADAVRDFLVRVGANPGRSGHRLSAEAARVVFECREDLARLFGVSDSRQIVFMLNATAALNAALWGLLDPDSQVVITSMEHNSVTRPLNRLKRQRGIEIRMVRADREGRVNPEGMSRAVTPRTRLVVVNHASNICGTLQPIGLIRQAIGDVPLLVDAAQTAGCVPIQVERDGIDLLAFSGHKSLLGPQGIGGLFISPRIELPPMVCGGTGSRSESDEQPDFLPDRHESGTPNTPGIAGLGAGVRYVLDQGVERIRTCELALLGRLMEGVRSVNGITLHGPSNLDDRIATLSFTAGNRSPSDVARLLDQEYGILVRAGLHCAPEAHRTLGTFPQGTVRLSLGAQNTNDDVDQAVTAVREICGS